MANTVNESAIKKLKLLFTVVDRNKGEFYLDVLSQYEVNFQTVINGVGTANSEVLDMLGLNRSTNPSTFRPCYQKWHYRTQHSRYYRRRLSWRNLRYISKSQC